MPGSEGHSPHEVNRSALVGCMVERACRGRRDPPLAMSDHESTPRAAPRPQPRVVLCPYCGFRSRDPYRCESCSGYFDPLSRQATQNAMGPWFVRDDAQPFRPGCSFETLRALVRRGRVTPETPIRGPTTRQFWVLAKRCPGVANLFGVCHACARPVEPRDRDCRHCGVSFEPPPDRQHLGLGSVRLLPGHAAPEDVAAMSEPNPGQNDPVPPPSAPSEPPTAIVRPPALAEDESVLARVEGLERNLRVLRRSRAVYLAAALVLLVSSAFVFAAPALGISLGPVDRWLGRGVSARPELAPPDLGTSQPVPVRPVPVPPAPPDPRGGESPASEPGDSSASPSGSDARDERAAAADDAERTRWFESLRRLEDLARSGRPEELDDADGRAKRAIDDGAPRAEVATLLDAVRSRRDWLILRTLP